MKIFMIILSILLFLIAALAGGCSALFTPVLFSGNANDMGGFWISGLAVAGLCFWAGFAVWQRRNDQTPSSSDPKD